jgi:hypothetical protein
LHAHLRWRNANNRHPGVSPPNAADASASASAANTTNAGSGQPKPKPHNETGKSFKVN